MKLIRSIGKNKSIPKNHPHGLEFSQMEKHYYDMEGMLKMLLEDLSQYTTLLHNLLETKSNIYYRLMYFYNKNEKKRPILNKLFKQHTRNGSLHKYVCKLQSEYQSHLEGEIADILKIFPKTRKRMPTLSKQKQKWNDKLAYYQSLKRSNRRQNDAFFTELAEVCTVMMCFNSVLFISC